MLDIYTRLGNGDVATWATVVFIVVALACIFAAAKAITWARGADARRHAGYLRDTHKITNA